MPQGTFRPEAMVAAIVGTAGDEDAGGLAASASGDPAAVDPALGLGPASLPRVHPAKAAAPRTAAGRPPGLSDRDPFRPETSRTFP